MDGHESNKLVKGALLLTLAGLISKILSAGYRIPLQNLTGDIGFYIYQQVYPILGIATVLALYGFPSAISKMVVDRKADGKSISFSHFYVPLFFILLGINGAFFLFLMFNANSLAVWVGDENLVRTYQIAAIIFLFIPFTALLRGVFQGNHQMKPTAYSQIGEQLVRVFIIIAAAFYIYFNGDNIYKIGQFAGIAAIVGAATAVFILSFFLVKNRPVQGEKTNIPWNDYVRTLVVFGVVASLNHMILLVIQFADTFTLLPSLMKHGLTKLEAMEAKGIFDRGQPLIQFGTVFGSSFALAIIPSLSKHKLKREPILFHQYIQSALSFSFYLAFGAMLGLLLIFRETNILLFQNDSGTTSLRILAIAIFLSSIVITASSILQGLGYVKRTASFILCAFFIKWIANQMLVPFWGITGSAIATILSLSGLCFIVLFELKRKLPTLAFFRKINWAAFVKAGLGMSGYILVVKQFMPKIAGLSRLSLLLFVVSIAITGAALYICLLIRCRAFTKKELMMLPLSSLWMRLAKEEVIHEAKN